MSIVSYAHSREAWAGHLSTLLRLVESCGARRICEVGGGANPCLSAAYIDEHGLDYTILDISPEELNKAPVRINKVTGDICGDLPQGLGSFDLVFTKMLCEHVADGERFHRNVHQMLKDDGLAFHFFPTLFAPPFVVNWMLPERLTSMLLDTFAPRDRERHGKFPARYSWCRGPVPRQLKRLRAVHYEILEYRGFYGHGYYKRIPLLRSLSDRTATLLVRHPFAELTAYAFVVLRKVRRDPLP